MKTKFCSTCKKDKLIRQFYKRKSSDDGLDTQCKDCKNKYKQKYRLKYPEKILNYQYKNRQVHREKEKLRKLKYPWETFYYHAMTLCNNKKVDSYKHYGLQGIKCLLFKEDVEHLWFRDNAELMDNPQLRRKDKKENYCIKNCEFIEKVFFQLGKDNPIHKDWIECKCYLCHKIINKKPSLLKNRKLNFCSNNCKILFYSGKNSHLYKDGEGTGNYPISFSYRLKNKIRKWDNYQCQNCGMTEEEHLIVRGQTLHVHHIDYDKQNCKDNNLVTVCWACNNRANFNKDYWQQFYQEKIRQIIPSKILEKNK